MSEKELGRALLNLDISGVTGVPNRGALTRGVIADDRRRVRRLAIATTLVWMVSLGLIGKVLIEFGLLFPAQAKFQMEVAQGGIGTEEQLRVQNLHLITFEHGTFLIALSVFVLAIAAMLTVVLLLASRRATLRQINANLLEISEQLKGGAGLSPM